MLLPPHMVRSLSVSFSYPFFFRLFRPPKLGVRISLQHTNNKSPKLFCGYWSRFRFACLSNTAALRVLDESAVEDDEVSWPNPSGDGFLHLLEERGIQANYQTFIWLLQGYMNVGASRDGKKLHGKILKMGLDVEAALCDKLLEFYLSANDLGSAVKVFDDMPSRNVFSWNKVISRFTDNNLGGEAVGLFLRMIAENASPNESTYAAILRTGSTGTVAFDYEQIHSRIICHGFSSSNRVCNRLIGLYCENGCTVSARKVFDRLYEKDKVSWVAMISGLSKNGWEQEAILLFSEMHESGTFPTPYVFSSVISACTKRELYRLGEQLHGHVIKQGFSSEVYVCNALVTLYSRSGSLICAEQIFSKMLQRDEVSYNSLISGLAQCGFSSRALDLFEKMQCDCLKPDCVTLASLVGACASVEALDTGKQLHSYAIKAGFLEDIIVEGSLLDLYVKCSDIKNAHEFFNATKTKNVGLWNVMLVLYGQLGDFCRSFEIFREMHVEGLVPNQYTYPSVLRTCILVKSLDLGKQIHTQVIKTGFQHNVYVCSVLIDMYAKLGQLDTAYEILRRVDEADVVSWTAMIAGFTQHDMFDRALELYGDMLRQGIQSDNIGFSSAISACAGIRALRLGKQIHGQTFVCGFSDDRSIRNALVSLYSRCGQMQQAYLAFEKIEDKDNVSWNALVSGFAQSGYCEEALQVFAQMHRVGVEADLFTFGAAVSAAANTANIKQGKQVHAMVLKTGYDSEVEACNSLITLYAKSGCIDDARNQFLEMPEKNEISWNAMITGYSQHGFGNKAIDLFESMKEFGIAPNHVTFIGVLSACSHVGLVNEGLAYFVSMSKEHGLEPKPEHYVCIVDLLGRAGLLDRARQFVEDMPIKPDAMVWRTLLSACVVHRNLEIGELAAHHLLELEPKDSASYALLSNLYAVSGEWTSKDQTRQTMKKKGVKKEPGRSWIEFQNTIHAFFVADKLHPLSDKIYRYLEDLNREATKIGYVKESYSLFSGMEQMQKDPTMHVHSEKLAITFGLLNLSSHIPVRVMKNLRVCNDCHSWIKFVSKISNRVIIVRDAYRFHHFENGSCSCKDYW